MAPDDVPRAQALFEVSWEVCNKVGGIHTVIRSKLPLVRALYPAYFAVGPLLEPPSAEFERRETPAQWKPVFTALEQRGVRCAYGAWRAPSEPETILVDASGLHSRKDAIKYLLWERFGIDSLRSSWEFEEPMCFAIAAGMLVEEYARQRPGGIALHCHEWLAGFALLHLKAQGVRAATVFTTHATMLGRTLMGAGHDLYGMLDTLDAKEWAYKLGVQDKHLAEVACAREADVFTTVSEITGIEAERILGRKSDVLLFNGFHTDRFPTFEETSVRHYESREMLRDFIAYFFFPHHAFDLDNTLIYFTSGRYELANKGIDVLIESLGALNARMKDEGSHMTIVVFFWLIMGRTGVKPEILEKKSFFSHVKSHVDWQSRPLLRRVALDLLSGTRPDKEDALAGEFMRQMHSDVSPLKRTGDPPMLTHSLGNEESEPILAQCMRQGLRNRQEDRVKVVLYPGYLDGSDGVLNVSYYDATAGAHLGIFPSLYEPWGYTPLESAVVGVPAVTTDLAGFGRYIRACEHDGENGVFVIAREKRPREDVVAQLTQRLYGFAHLDHEGRVQHRFAAKNLAAMCDWKRFIGRYVEAHNLALMRSGA